MKETVPEIPNPAASDGSVRSLLEVHGLIAGFHVPGGFAQAVDGVDFTVGRGSFVGLVGESGSGKSTVVRSLVRLLRPPGEIRGGRVVFEGRDLMRIRESEMRRLRGAKISFITQNPFAVLHPVLQIRKQFRNFIAAHRTMARSEIDSVALQQLESVRIKDPQRVLHGYAHELSGGMAQRVVIAMALALKPSLVIADEPTTALDVTVQRQILELMRLLIADQHRSLLLVTHDVGIVAQYCDHVVVMFSGTVVESGPVSRVLLEPQHPYTQRLLQSVKSGLDIIPTTDEYAGELAAPSGCPYRLRCPHVMDHCSVERPQPRRSGDSLVSCFLYEAENG